MDIILEYRVMNQGHSCKKNVKTKKEYIIGVVIQKVFINFAA